MFNAELKHLLVDAEDGLQLARSGSTSAARRSRSARPASSTASTTRWSRSSAWPRPKGCCSSTARAPGTNLSPIRSSKELLQGGGTASRPRQLHARLRRLRRRHQVGRQDPPRRQDGDARHRPPRHRRVHLVQGQGREEGLDADRRRLRRLVRRRGLQVDLLPELEQLGARHRRLHGGRARRTATGRRAPCATAPRRDDEGARNCGATSPRRPGSAAIPACSTTRPSTTGTPRRGRRASTPRTPAASTCTSTTRPATWRRSTCASSCSRPRGSSRHDRRQ